MLGVCRAPTEWAVQVYGFEDIEAKGASLEGVRVRVEGYFFWDYWCFLYRNMDDLEQDNVGRSIVIEWGEGQGRGFTGVRTGAYVIIEGVLHFVAPEYISIGIATLKDAAEWRPD
jgi:hypothetical protein